MDANRLMSMSGRYLLDTNVVIALFANETATKNRLKEVEEVFVPCITLGELYYGAHKSKRRTNNIRQIKEFASQSIVLNCDTDTAQRYGEIKNELRQKGRPIPENDIWIAAIAQQNNLILVTSDDHFREVENLKVEAW